MIKADRFPVPCVRATDFPELTKMTPSECSEASRTLTEKGLLKIVYICGNCSSVVTYRKTNYCCGNCKSKETPELCYMLATEWEEHLNV